MKKNALLITSIIVIGSLLAACQAAPVASTGAQPIQRSISAWAQGQVYLTPDIARIMIGVHSQSNSVNEALEENNAKSQAVSDALVSLGVDPKDIQTSNFSVYPQQQYGPNGEMTGDVIYMVDNAVNVTVRDLTKLGSMLDTVVNTGANAINGISFDVSNKEEAMTTARRNAIDNAKRQAAEIAEAAGVELGEIINVSINNSSSPIPMFDGRGMAQAASDVPISSGQLSIIVEATVTYAIK
jgi:uncharacterized protein YggE